PSEEPLFHESSTKKPPDQIQQSFVPNASPQKGHELLVMDMVEEAFNITVNYPIHLALPNGREAHDVGNCGVTGPPRPKPMAEVQKVALEDGLQNQLDCHLDPSVVERWDSQRTHLSILLGNVDALHWVRLEGTFAQLLEESGLVTVPIFHQTSAIESIQSWG